MTLRLAMVSTLVLLCATPAFAQDDMRRQVAELRARLMKSEDRMLEMARRFDQEKKRLQDEKEALLQEVSRLKRENTLLEVAVASLRAEKSDAKKDGAKKKAFIDDRTLTLNFNETPVSEVGSFLRDVTGLNLTVTSSVPSDAVVSLQVQDMTIRNILDQICANARTADGERVPLMWRLKSGAIQIAKKKAKKR